MSNCTLIVTRPALYTALLVLGVGCGGDEGLGQVEQACRGLEGSFLATPTLGFNNCSNTPPVLPKMRLEVGAQDWLKACGWHDLGLSSLDSLPGCHSVYKRSLRTFADKYRGLIIFEVQCLKGSSCGALWELEFEQTAVPYPGRL